MRNTRHKRVSLVRYKYTQYRKESKWEKEREREKRRQKMDEKKKLEFTLFRITHCLLKRKHSRAFTLALPSWHRLSLNVAWHNFALIIQKDFRIILNERESTDRAVFLFYFTSLHFSLYFSTLHFPFLSTFCFPLFSLFFIFKLHSNFLVSFI